MAVASVGAVRVAWWPIPLLLAAVVVLRLTGVEGEHGSPVLLISLNFVFSALTSLIVAFLAARSFLLRGSPGLLLLGCGVLVWGVATIVSVATEPHDVNKNITIYNAGAWLAALCHFSGALLSVRTRRIPHFRALTLAATYSAALGALALVAYAAFDGWTPHFFIQGQGGTPVRQAVLASAAAMFVLTAIVLRAGHHRSSSSSPFTYWYALAMLLITIGLSGVMLQTVFNGTLNWTARGAQYLGGLYMLMAAVVSVRDTQAWEISLADALTEARQRYEDLFHLAMDGIVVQELTAGAGPRRVIQANRAMCELLGYELDELRTLAPLAIVAEEDRPAMSRHYQVVPGTTAAQRELTLIAKDGSRIVTEVNTRLFREHGMPIAISVFRDIRARKESEQQLRELAQRLTYHVDNSPLAVIEWGPDMRLARWSDEAERLFGWKASEVLGKRIEDFRWIYVDDQAQVEQVAKALAQGQMRKFSVNRNYRKDGSVVYCEWYNSSLLDERGNLRSILSLVLDVTARTEAERELRRLNADLEQFAYAASHDLQEPLRTVSLFSELLDRQYGRTLDPQAREYLNHVLTGARRTLNLLAGLRAYLQAADERSRVELTDAAACLEDVLAGLQQTISRENATITASGLPSVAVNSIHLQQLFQNLIGNGLKFRGEAPPQICVWAEPVGSMWKFAVRDNGIGIDSRHCRQIFGVFKRLHAQERFEGTGIGLAICQKIVERYGGSIWVESQKGEGSTFFFTLPGSF